LEAKTPSTKQGENAPRERNAGQQTMNNAAASIDRAPMIAMTEPSSEFRGFRSTKTAQVMIDLAPGVAMTSNEVKFSSDIFSGEDWASRLPQSEDLGPLSGRYRVITESRSTAPISPKSSAPPCPWYRQFLPRIFELHRRRRA
jgi:hypothetical protein